MRVEDVIYREPLIHGAAVNDSRATKRPVLGNLCPLKNQIPSDFVMDAGVCMLHEMGHPLGGPHFATGGFDFFG